MTETSTKPYFIRALHEWATDNGYTPHIVVQVDASTRVPRAFVQDGQITLNIGMQATNKLVIGNDFIDFQARFGGKTENISVPVGTVTAIYARETGAGMGFEVESPNQGVGDEEGSVRNSVHDSTQETEPSDTEKPQRPHLKVVK